MRITKVATRTGDGGTTHLVGGQEVSKADPRVQAYGSVDELGASIGLARTFAVPASKALPELAEVAAILEGIQQDLFVLAGELATLPSDRWDGMPLIAEREVQRLELQLEAQNSKLPPLEDFILAGGGVVSAFLHQARTLCRRVERQVVLLAESGLETDRELLDSALLRYLNRLGDLLFVLARCSARAAGQQELTWQRG